MGWDRGLVRDEGNGGPNKYSGQMGLRPSVTADVGYCFRLTLVHHTQQLSRETAAPILHSSIGPGPWHRTLTLSQTDGQTPEENDEVDRPPHGLPGRRLGFHGPHARPHGKSLFRSSEGGRGDKSKAALLCGGVLWASTTHRSGLVWPLQQRPHALTVRFPARARKRRQAGGIDPQPIIHHFHLVFTIFPFPPPLLKNK